MAESDYDGNNFGRVAALSIIISACFFAAKMCGPYACPVGKSGKSRCIVSDQLRDAVSDTVSGWEKSSPAQP